IFPSLLDGCPAHTHRRLFQNLGRMKDFIARSVRDHQASLDPSSPRDFIDCFLTKTAGSPEERKLNRGVTELAPTSSDIDLGGMGRTGSAPAVLEPAPPSLASRALEETYRVVGSDWLRALGDRIATPYTDAVIREVQQFAGSPYELAAPSTQDTTFRGFLLPKTEHKHHPLLNTVLCGLSQFLTPQEFNPDFFFYANKSFKKSPAFMAFSAGQPLWLGQSLVRMRSSTTIRQRFSRQPLGAPEDTHLPLSQGLLNLLRPFQLCPR
uniref:Uncharacterized protein n=1 Tax=Myotis lucifugus TaxID=59463 RepID=G1Q4R0_MYOLU